MLRNLILNFVLAFEGVYLYTYPSEDQMRTRW